MAKLPIYEQQTLPGSVRASGQEFGAGVAQAAGQLGGVVADIGLQMQRRQDVIERVQLAGEFDKWAQDSLTTLNDTGDIGTKATVDQYTNGLREKASEIVKRHGGGMNSRAELQAQIENQAAQYAKSATAAQVKAQQTIIGNTVEQKVNELAISATFAPDKMFDTFTELDRTIDMLGDAMSPQLAAQYKEAGRSKIAQNSISRLLTNGNYTTAKAIMENPEVGKYLDPDSSRRFGIEIAVDEGKQAEETRRLDREVQNWTTRLKRDLTPEEIIRIKSLPVKKSDMTPSDKIVEYELITQKPAPQSVIDDMFDIESGGAGSMFGNSLQGRALAFVTEKAVAYSNGMLSPDQARQYEASLAEAYKPVTRTDSTTGRTETFTPTVPAFVQQAAEQGSRFYGGGALTSRASQGGAMPGQRIELRDSTGRVIGQTTVGADGNWSIKDYNDPSGGGVAPPQAGPSGEGVDGATLTDLAPMLTGVSSAMGRAVANAPLGIGDTFGNQDYTRAATRASRMVEEVTGATKPETKIAEQYRQELRDLVDLGTKTWGSEGAYYARAVEIDKELRRKLSEVNKKIDGSSMTTLEERKAAVEIRNDIQAVLPQLGVPQTIVKSRKDIEALPPGTRFRVGDDPRPYTRK